MAGQSLSSAEFNAIVFRQLGADYNGIVGALQQRSDPPNFNDLHGQLVSYELLLHSQQTPLSPLPTAQVAQTSSGSFFSFIKSNAN